MGGRVGALAALSGPVARAESWLPWLRDAFAPTPDRFDHLEAVWRRALELRPLHLPWLDGERRRRLELAALLHDVGRALDPGNTEPHGFVGARFLEAVGLGDVAPLVAHHSGARYEAEGRGMAHLDRWHDDDPDLLAVLTYLDRTTSPTGQRVSLGGRRDGLVDRYGPSSLEVAVFDRTSPEIERAIDLLSGRTGD